MADVPPRPLISAAPRVLPQRPPTFKNVEQPRRIAPETRGRFVTKTSAAAIFVLVALALAPPAAAWGLRTHRLVTEAAASRLPAPVRKAFDSRSGSLAEAAVAPDVIFRARDGEREAIRHFIHLDEWGPELDPLAVLPLDRAESRAGRDRLRARGTLLWVILDSRRTIVSAMRAGDWDGAIVAAGHASHYLADAFMPLHVTSASDGQGTLAGRGLHAALERDLVDPRIDEILAGLPHEPAALAALDGAHLLARLRDVRRDVPRLLAAHERAFRAAAVGEPAYLEVLGREGLPILERRLAEAIGAIASLFLSSWDEAGRPHPR
jgi:hypothetical protein